MKSVQLNGTYINDIQDSKGFKMNFAWIFAVALFVLNENVRSIFSEEMGWVNIIFFATCICFCLTAIRKRNVRLSIFFIVIFYSIFVLINTAILHKSLSYIIMTLANLIAPMFLLSIKIKHELAIKYLNTVLKILNIVIILLTIIGIFDYVTHSSVQLFLANTVFNGTQFSALISTENSWGVYRYYSIIGHPLTGAKYYLIFFILNNIYSKYERSMINNYLVSIITMTGLFLSGSKTALALGLILVLFFSDFKKNKIVYFLLIVGAMTVLFNTALFENNLKIRYMQGLEFGDMTSGRNVLLKELFSSTIEKPNLFLGGGADYSRLIAESLGGSIHNFEYPVFMLAYDYGIFLTMIMYFLILIYPVIKLKREKKYYILFLFLLLSVMINTNNGIANLGSDSMSQVCFIIFILINLGKENNVDDTIFRLVFDRKKYEKVDS